MNTEAIKRSVIKSKYTITKKTTSNRKRSVNSHTMDDMVLLTPSDSFLSQYKDGHAHVNLK